MRLKISCCIPCISLWISLAWHITSQTHREGKARASSGRRRCLCTSHWGPLQLYIRVSGHHWGGNRALGYCLLEYKFSFMLTHSLWNGAPRQVKCSMAAWVSLCCELGINGKQWAGGRSIRKCWNRKQGGTRPPSSFLVLHSLSTVQSQSPIHTFFQITNLQQHIFTQ